MSIVSHYELVVYCYWAFSADFYTQGTQEALNTVYESFNSVYTGSWKSICHGKTVFQLFDDLVTQVTHLIRVLNTSILSQLFIWAGSLSHAPGSFCSELPRPFGAPLAKGVLNKLR